MKNIVCFTFFILFIFKATASNNDSILEVKIREVVRSTFKQNLINESNNEQFKNNYLINVIMNENNISSINVAENFKQKTIDNPDPQASLIVSPATITSVNQKLVAANARNVTFNNNVYFGAQFYILLIDGVPIHLEKQIPSGSTIAKFIGGEDEVQVLAHNANRVVTLDNGSKKIIYEQGYGDKLMSTKEKVLKIFNDELNQLSCEITTSNTTNALLSKPIFLNAVLDYKIYNDYELFGGNGNIYRGLVRQGFIYHFTDDGIKCKNTSNTITNNYLPGIGKIGYSFYNYVVAKQDYKTPNLIVSTSDEDRSLGYNTNLIEMADWLAKCQDEYFRMIELSVNGGELIESVYSCVFNVKSYQEANHNSMLYSNNFLDDEICQCFNVNGFPRPSVRINNILAQTLPNLTESLMQIINSRRELLSRLMKVDVAGYNVFNKEQRLKILKILGAPNDNAAFDPVFYSNEFEEGASHVISNILQTVKTKVDADYLIANLGLPNELSIYKSPDNKTLLGCLDRIVKNDELSADGELIGGAYMAQFNTSLLNLFRLANPQFSNVAYISEFLNAQSELVVRRHSLVYNTKARHDINYFKTTVSTNDDYIDKDLWPIGTNYFDIASYSTLDNKVRINKKTIEDYMDLNEQQYNIKEFHVTNQIQQSNAQYSGMGTPTESNSINPQNGLNFSLRYVMPDYKQVKVLEEPLEFDPFEWVVLADYNNVKESIFSQVTGQNNYTTNDEGLNVSIVPAYFLKYPNDISKSIKLRRKHNEIWQSVEGVVDVVSFIIPPLKAVTYLNLVGRAMWLGKTMNAFRKMSQVIALTHLASAANDGWGAEKSKLTKVLGIATAVTQAIYGAGQFSSWVYLKNSTRILDDGALLLKELAKPGIMEGIVDGSKNMALAENVRNEYRNILILKEWIETMAVNQFGKQKDWFVRWINNYDQTLAGTSFQKVINTNLLFEDAAIANSLFNKASGVHGRELLAFNNPLTNEFIFKKALTEGIPEKMKEFKLVKGMNGSFVDGVPFINKSFIVGRTKNLATNLSEACIIGPPYCFTGNTLIHTTNNGPIPFDQLQDGTEILTYDATDKKSMVQNIGKIVRSTTNKLVKIFAGGEVIMATPEHPFYEATNGWTLAGSFKKGMHFLLATGLSLSIDSVAAIDSTCTVYNCDVPVTHTYYVGNNAILAHNANICDELVVAVLNKLGKGYDAAGVRVGLENIFSKYKILKNANTEEEIKKIINELSKLCSDKISSPTLSSLLGEIGADATKANQFANDIKQYKFLDDFAKDGRLLDNYKAIRFKNSMGYKSILGDLKANYPKYFDYLYAVKKIMPRLDAYGLTVLSNKINSITDVTLKNKFISDFIDAPIDALKILNKHPKCFDVWKTFIGEAQTLCGSDALNFAKHFEVRGLLKLGKYEDAVRLYGGQLEAAKVINGVNYVEMIPSSLVTKINDLIARTDDVAKIGIKLRAQGHNITDEMISFAKKHYFEAEHLYNIESNRFVIGRFSKDLLEFDQWKNFADLGNSDGHFEFFKLIRHEYIEAKLMKEGLPFRGMLNIPNGTFLKYGAHELSTNINGLNNSFFSHWLKSPLFNSIQRTSNSIPGIEGSFDDIFNKIKQIEGIN